MKTLDRRKFILGAAACFCCLLSGKLFAATIKMRTLYNKDLSFSDLAKSLEGNRIDISGYMAPPLKAESHFFVLTKKPMAVCPFCGTDADWPDDIVAIYTKRLIDVVPFNSQIVVSGILELGSFTDEDTGFVSRVRLVDASYRKVS